jgi:hypothetical protein
VAAFFLDTSTVPKRYIQETGTAWVQALAAPTVRHSLFVVRITLVETVAAITRLERGGSITPQDAGTAVADFQLDFACKYRVVEVSAGLVTQATTLARRLALRDRQIRGRESYWFRRKTPVPVTPVDFHMAAAPTAFHSHSDCQRWPICRMVRCERGLTGVRVAPML